MYKVASENRQAALRRGRPWSYASGEEEQSDEDRRRNLRAAIQQLDERIQRLHPKSPDRKKLGSQKQEWQEQLRILNLKVKANNLDHQTLVDCFVDVAREQLTRVQFHTIMAAAERLCEQKQVSADGLRSRIHRDHPAGN